MIEESAFSREQENWRALSGAMLMNTRKWIIFSLLTYEEFINNELDHQDPIGKDKINWQIAICQKVSEERKVELFNCYKELIVLVKALKMESMAQL